MASIWSMWCKRTGEVEVRGFVPADIPDHGRASATGQIVEANLVCPSAGRGSVVGCAPPLLMELVTNSSLFCHIAHDMNIVSSSIQDGDKWEYGEWTFKLIHHVAFESGVAAFAPSVPGMTA
jgi:altronate hydrolase